MGLPPTQGNEELLGPASTLYGTVALSLSSRPERSGAEGPAVPRTRRGDVFSTGAQRSEEIRGFFVSSHTPSSALICSKSVPLRLMPSLDELGSSASIRVMVHDQGRASLPGDIRPCPLDQHT
jgi:hypothetical protein